jgi:two-component system cell cycle response regulator
MVLTCKAQLRAMDMLARWGGEEFLILLPETDPQAAVVTAERLRQSVAAMRVPVGSNASIAFTISVGVAEPINNSLHDLLHRVDDALYSAKAGGRNRVVVAAQVLAGHP